MQNSGINRDGLLSLYHYNFYANKLVLDTVEQLDQAEFTQSSSPSHGSVQKLLIHMLGCEASFLYRCLGKSLEDESVDLSTLAGIRQNWSGLEQEQIQYIGQLGEADLARNIPFQPKGKLLVFPVREMLLQAMIHSTHHRGELSIVLTGLGHPLPTLDIILYFTQQSGQVWS